GNVLDTSAMRNRVFPKFYDDDYFGATLTAEAALKTAAVIESSQAGTVLIGSSREQVVFNQAMHANVLAEMAQKALRVFPFLSDAAIILSYGGFRSYIADLLPIIRVDPRIPGLFHCFCQVGA